jgi:hypothetical protein
VFYMNICNLQEHGKEKVSLSSTKTGLDKLNKNSKLPENVLLADRKRTPSFFGLGGFAGVIPPHEGHSTSVSPFLFVTRLWMFTDQDLKVGSCDAVKMFERLGTYNNCFQADRPDHSITPSMHAK